MQGVVSRCHRKMSLRGRASAAACCLRGGRVQGEQEGCGGGGGVCTVGGDEGIFSRPGCLRGRATMSQRLNFETFETRLKPFLWSTEMPVGVCWAYANYKRTFKEPTYYIS